MLPCRLLRLVQEEQTVGAEGCVCWQNGAGFVQGCAGSCKGVRPATPRDEKADLHFDEEVLHIDDLVPDQALQARTLKSRIIRYVSDYCDYECSTLVKSEECYDRDYLNCDCAMRL